MVPSALPSTPSEAPPHTRKCWESDSRRPSHLQHSQGIHPEGSVSTPSGATQSVMLRRRRLAKRTLSNRSGRRATLQVKGLSFRSPKRRDGERISQSSQEGERFVFHRPQRPWVRGSNVPVFAEECGVRSKGMCGRAACLWTSSNARSIKSRGRSHPAKDLRAPRTVLFPPNGGKRWTFSKREGSTTRHSGFRCGRREGEVIFAWKRGSQASPQREQGNPWLGPTSRRSQSKRRPTRATESGLHQRSFARHVLRAHHEW